MRAVEGTERVDGTTALVSVVLGQKLYVANGTCVCGCKCMCA